MDYTNLGQSGSGGGTPIGPTGSGSGPSSPVKVSRVDVSQAFPLIQVSWQFTKKNYRPIVIASGLYAFVLLAFSRLEEFAGLAAIPGVLLNAGFIVLVKKIHEKTQPPASDSGVEEVLSVLKDMNLVMRLLPVILVGLGIGFFQSMVGPSMGFLGSIFNLFLSLTMVALTAFSVPLMMLQNVAFGKTVELNIQASTLNWEFMLAAGIMLMGVVMVSAMLFLLPLLFVGLPVALVSGYFMYAMMFEGAEVSNFRQ